MKTKRQGKTEDKIISLYERLSHDEELQGICLGLQLELRRKDSGTVTNPRL